MHVPMELYTSCVPGSMEFAWDPEVPLQVF